MTLNQSFECNSPDVVFENFGDEVILLNLQSGRYYSLNPIGMLYWEQLTRGIPHGYISSRLCEFYSNTVKASQIERELEALFAEFEAEELIRPSAAAAPTVTGDAALSTANLPPEYTAPVMSKYDDVAEMMLLDPVHDVGEVGWPQPAPAKHKEDLRSE